ncbi:MAG: YncE family protein [Thermoplasmata archaeon]|nr:YncE family protein [Thermoplasmata archaeon]
MGPRSIANISEAAAIQPEIGTVLATPSKGLNFPGPPVYDPQNGYVYVPNEGLGTVSVVEGGRVIATVPVGASPAVMAVDNSSGLVYVANSASGNVSVLNGTDVSSTLTVGTSPFGLALDPANGYLYVANYGSNTVSVFHGTTLLATVSVAVGPESMLYDPANGFVYVSDDGGASNDRVSVINGTQDVADLVVGQYPETACLDSTNGLVYVPNLAGSGGITVISGARDVANISDAGGPNACAYDPSNDQVYVADNQAGTVSIVHGTSLLGSVTVGTSPEQVAFDSANGYVYVSDFGTGVSNGTLSVLNGTGVVGNVTVGVGPTNFAYDAATADLYVSDQGGNTLSVVSTALAIGSIVLTPPGSPRASLDLGTGVEFSGKLWAIGAGQDNLGWNSTPSAGLGCPPTLNVTVATAFVEQASFILSCVPTMAASYTLRLNVTDRAGIHLNLSFPFSMFQNPRAALPIVSGAPGVRSTFAFTNKTVNFSATPLRGTGIYANYTWYGLPAQACTGLATSEARCSIPAPTSLNVSYRFTDSNGRTASSAPLSYGIFQPMTIGSVSASRNTSDAGSPVSFNATVAGGSGTYFGFAWVGLPGTCPVPASEQVSCTFESAGRYAVYLRAFDTLGETVESPVRDILILPAITVSDPIANRSSADVGQDVAFATSATGGDGNWTYHWSGLPAGCAVPATSAIVPCVPTKPGLSLVRVAVTDTSGGDAVAPPDATLVVANDPTVSAPFAETPTIVQGTAVRTNVTVSGGTGSITYAWFGGCSGTSATATCAFERPGSYPVWVVVTDGNGFAVRSQVTTFTVTTAPSLGASNFGPSVVDLLALTSLAVAAGAVGLWFRYRNARPPMD